MHWSNYSAKTVARIQARGMPIDMPLWNLVQENKQAVIGALIQRFDPSHGSENPIYSPDGEWSNDRFAHWLVSAGIAEWPRLDSGALELTGDAFRMMYGAHPAIEGLHALRDSLGVIVRARIPIGRDGRNRPSLFPFGTATGRNAQAKSLFNAHASMRSFMKFPADKIGLYLDWRTQEVGDCSGAQRRCGAGRRLSVGRHLSRARNALRPDQRHRHQALEERQSRPAPADEGAAARHQLRHGRSLAVPRPRPAPADRQRGDHPAPAPISDGSGSGAQTWSNAPCWSA